MNALWNVLNDAIKMLHSLITGPGLLILLIAVGIFFFFRTDFFPILHFRKWMNFTIISLFRSGSATKTSDRKAISPFQSLATALAGTMGTGNIVGVATALTLGGAGAIFWMWVAGFVGMATKFAEVVLSIRYRERNHKGEWSGGPMYYMSKGLNMKWLAGTFGVILVFAALGTGNITQANAVAGTLFDTFGVPPIATGIILAVLVGISILGGIKRIASITEKLIPFISILYILAGIVIIAVNYRAMPSVLNSIFTEAFSLKATTGGLAGSGMMVALRYGVSRGVYTNEAGLGTSCLVHSAADVKHPVEQGMWGIFEVFADTIVVCSITAFAMLSTGVAFSGISETAIASAAFESVFGSYAGIFICLSIVIFGFATLIGWSYYGEKALEYLSGSSLSGVYRAVYLIVIIVGCCGDLHAIWSLADAFNGLLAIPNLLALVLLSPQVAALTKNYLSKRNKQA